MLPAANEASSRAQAHYLVICSEVTGSLIVQFIGYTQVSLGLLYLAFVFVLQVLG